MTLYENKISVTRLHTDPALMKSFIFNLKYEQFMSASMGKNKNNIVFKSNPKP